MIFYLKEAIWVLDLANSDFTVSPALNKQVIKGTKLHESKLNVWEHGKGA